MYVERVPAESRAFMQQLEAFYISNDALLHTPQVTNAAHLQSIINFDIHEECIDVESRSEREMNKMLPLCHTHPSLLKGFADMCPE